MPAIPCLSIIVAMTVSGVIGRKNALPFDLPSDRKRFKKITMAHPVIMGRKTWESIPLAYRPLSGRSCIILTLNRNYQAPGAFIATSPEEAFRIARSCPGSEEIFVAGGEQLYKEFLPITQKVYQTFVDAPASLEGDAYFPEKLLMPDWKCTGCFRVYTRDPGDEYPTAFVELVRGI